MPRHHWLIRFVVFSIAVVACQSWLPAQDEPVNGEENEPEKQFKLTATPGTHRDKIETMLGVPIDVSVIPSLRRAKAVYADGTEIIYLDHRLLSYSPGQNANRNVDGGYVVRRDTARVVFPAETLRVSGILVADDLIKREIETSFPFRAPPRLPHTYGDFPYGPPRIYHPQTWPVHAERIMPMRRRGQLHAPQHLYYPPSPYVVPASR